MVQPSAEHNLGRASVLIRDTKDLSLQLPFKLSQSKVSDLKRWYWCKPTLLLYPLRSRRQYCGEHEDLVSVFDKDHVSFPSFRSSLVPASSPFFIDSTCALYPTSSIIVGRRLLCVLCLH